MYSQFFNITTAASIDPVTLTEFKNHVRVSSSTEDTLMTNMISTATKRCEEYCRRAFITATWTSNLNEFPSNAEPITLRPSALIAVTSITYKDTDGVSQTWAASNYQTFNKSEPGVVALEPTASYPSTESGRLNAIQILYTVGYGTLTTDVPEEIRSAILIFAAHLFENRDMVTSAPGFAQNIPIPKIVHLMLDDYALRELV